MHSIGYAASQFDIELDLVFPAEMAPTAEWKAELAEKNTRFHEVPSVQDCIAKADVIYMEPVVQADYTKSRVDPAEAKKGLTPPQYKVTRELMREKAKPGAIILHSLPRMDELPADVDATRHARYWIEAFNGVVLRMALIALVLGRAE
jgi:aspartate carbamoyltransferase catalytic subunit